jgi:hypothetical protein
VSLYRWKFKESANSAGPPNFSSPYLPRRNVSQMQRIRSGLPLRAKPSKGGTLYGKKAAAGVAISQSLGPTPARLSRLGCAAPIESPESRAQGVTSFEYSGS